MLAVEYVLAFKSAHVPKICCPVSTGSTLGDTYSGREAVALPIATSPSPPCATNHASANSFEYDADITKWSYMEFDPSKSHVAALTRVTFVCHSLTVFCRENEH
jgi:hypothetical protein